MKIINFGSLNIDKVYNVSDFVRPGQTISALNLNTFCGGKGLNQSIAAARAGANVVHAGAVGPDGDMLVNALKESGVDVSQLAHLPGDSGHAIIQVSQTGENCIIVSGGTNQQLSEAYIDSVLAGGCPGDVVLMQNEVNNLPYIMHAAKAKNLKIALNPSPITPALLEYPLELADWLLVNETEGAQISGCNGSHPEILKALHEKYPQTAIVLTLGSDGVLYQDANETAGEKCFKVKAVDTTAAGDTFTGFFLTCCLEGMPVQQCLTMASKASAIAVTRAGASTSIPMRSEVESCSL